VAGGEEIDVDEHGRVVVVFQWDDHWDEWKGPPGTTDPPTRRIAVTQGWAGPQRGLLTIPRLGDEVVVAYIDGDPDEPVIVGRLYNGRNEAAVDLPGDRTQSVWRTQSSPEGDGFHELRFEDKKGAEELHIEAQRLHTRLVKGDEQIDVGGGRTIHVGGSQIVKIGANLDIHAEGNITETADGSHRIRASTTAVESSQRLEKTNGPHDIVASTVTIQATRIDLVAGGSAIRITGDSIIITAPLVYIN
jgi:type VI secretion system secreted protein VgrG